MMIYQFSSFDKFTKKKHSLQYKHIYFTTHIVSEGIKCIIIFLESIFQKRDFCYTTTITTTAADTITNHLFFHSSLSLSSNYTPCRLPIYRSCMASVREAGIQGRHKKNEIFLSFLSRKAKQTINTYYYMGLLYRAKMHSAYSYQSSRSHHNSNSQTSMLADDEDDE